MAVSVFVAATLRSFTNHNARLESEGGSIEEILNMLTDEYPEIGKALFDEENHLRPFVFGRDITVHSRF